MAYSTDTFLNIAINGEAIVRNVAPRSILAAGMAIYFAAAGETDNTKLVTDTFRELLKQQGATKGEVSTKIKNAKIAADNMGKRFSAELASTYANESDLVTACFATAAADGVKSVARLMDYMQHGDADYTDRAKQAEKEAKEAEKSAALADNVAAVTGQDVDPNLVQSMIANPVAPAPVEVQNFEPAPEQTDFAAMLAKFTDADLAAIADAAAAEITRRAEEATANVA